MLTLTLSPPWMRVAHRCEKIWCSKNLGDKGSARDAAGSCVAVETARVMVSHAYDLKRAVRFVLFAGEEVGCFGSTAYVNQHLEEFDSTSFMLNLDDASRGSRPGILLQGFLETIPFVKRLRKKWACICR